MTLEQARNLRKGDFITHRTTAPPHKPCRVSAVWHNDTDALVLIRVAVIAGHRWLHAMGYELPPAGCTWDGMRYEWVSADEMRRRSEARRA